MKNSSGFTPFDPIEEQTHLLSSYGMRRQLAWDFDEDREKELLGTHGGWLLHAAITCIVVRLDQPAMWLLEKAIKWLDAERNADAAVFYNTAQCKWLLWGVHDEESLRQSTALHDLDRHNQDWGADEVELALPVWLESGEFEKACQIFENTPGTAKPTNINKIDREGSMAYVVCLHKLGRKYTREEVDYAVDCYFRHSIRDLLSRNHYDNVARWMKLIFWNKEKDSREAAWQALLRCYDFLPDVERPKG